MPTTIGQIIVNEALPEKYRDYNRTIGEPELNDLLASIIEHDPDVYRDVSAKLMRIGNKAAYEGGTTLRMSDIAPPMDNSAMYRMLDAEEEAIRRDRRLTDDQRRDALASLYDKVYAGTRDMAYDRALKANNSFALQVKSKARGNKDQLSAMINTPGVYQDASGRTIPFFIRHSYAEGLSPAEYWASLYGARASIISTKFATARAGALGKMLSSASIEQVVTEDDCGTPNGMPTTTDDNDNVGAVLAQKAGKYDAGTVITKQVLADLRNDKIDDILVRSPTTCNAKNGVCAHCAGIRENGKFPEIGYNLGLNAASALAERIAQGGLNMKHCLVEGTLVRMADGSKKTIEKLVPGDMVLGSDVHGNITPTKVVALYDNGIEECIRTRFIENGTQRKDNPGIVLESTDIHKILGTRVVTGQLEERFNWLPRKLEVGKKSREFFGYTVSSFDDRGLVHEPLAMLIGALLGDGCYTKSVGGVYLSCADDTEIDDIERTLIGHDIRLHRMRYHNGIYYMVSQSRSIRGKNVVKNYLKKHGMYGKRANEKEIPSVVHTWDNASVGSLIGGFIAADGCVYSTDKYGKPGVAFSSTSRKMLEQIREIIHLRFGILGSRITKTSSEKTFSGNYDLLQFTVTKPSEVRKLYDSTNIPGVKRERLRRMLEAYKPGKNFVRTAFKRVEQVPIGKRHVYDIEVEHPDHLFLLANGLIVSNSGKKQQGVGYSGFDMLKRMVDVPKQYTDRATVSEVDGTVTKIVPAPQGGSYVYVGDERHYVPNGYDVLVKKGDEVEAGDQLSDGVVNPADAVRLKGIGEGRRYFTQRFTQAYRDSGYKTNRRNVEAVAKSLIDNVVVEDPDAEGEMLPGDDVSYARWAWGYRPRPDSVQSSPKQAIGKYLEQPALHYTIGTRVTPKVVKELEKFKVPSVLYNPNPVGVRPEMRSIVESTGQTDDWMGRLGTTYLGKRLVEDAQLGSDSNSKGLNPYPAVAKGVTLGQWGSPGHRNEEFHY